MRLIYGFLLLLLAVPAHAQEIPDAADPMRGFKAACPSCGVHAFVDWPGPGTTVTRSTMVLAGWGFECVSGQPVDRVELWYEASDGTFKMLKQDRQALHDGAVYRPDVQQQFGPSCPAVAPWSGWWLQVTNPPPAGARRVLVTIWRGPWHATLTKTLNFVE